MTPFFRLAASGWVAHLMLWMLYLLPSAPYYLERKPVGEALGAIGLGAGYFALFVYANLFYFLPRFFFRDQRGTYLLLTLGVAALYAGAGTLLFERFTDEHPPVLLLLARLYVLSFAFGFLDSYVRGYKTRNRLLQLEQLQTQLVLEQLKSQLNPHFLFNTLHNLYALTLRPSPQAPEVVLGLASLMRYMFTHAQAERVSLAREADYVAQYVALERLRLGPERASINVVAQGPLHTVELPPMLLMPLVENAFKHGVASDMGPVLVSVTLAVQAGEVFFEVVNSKPAGPTTPTLPVAIGTGLANLRQRLTLLYPHTHRLLIDDQPHTFTATLALQP